MKTSDISDEAFLRAVIRACAERQHAAATRWDVACVLAGHPELVGTATGTQDWPNVPPKIVLSKAKRLIQRGLIEGCACGCRGDFEVRPTVSDRAREILAHAIAGSMTWMDAWRRAQRELWARA